MRTQHGPWDSHNPHSKAVARRPRRWAKTRRGDPSRGKLGCQAAAQEGACPSPKEPLELLLQEPTTVPRHPAPKSQSSEAVTAQTQTDEAARGLDFGPLAGLIVACRIQAT